MILLDSSFIAAYSNLEDENNRKATTLMKDIAEGKYGDVYITNFIFDESVTVILMRTGRLDMAIETGERLRKATEPIDIDNILFEAGWNLFKSQKKTKFSFTDCTTIAVMMKTGIRNIATFDEEFKKIRGINVIGIE